MSTRNAFPVRFGAVALAACVVVGITLAGTSEARAEARFIDLHGELMTGAMTGRGNDPVAPDFFHQTQGPGFGVEVGVRLLVLDLSIRFMQMVGADGREGTLLHAMFGPSLVITLQGGGTDMNGKRRPPKLVLRPGLAAGLGFGTPAPIHGGQLTGDQLSAKGLLVMGRCGVERFFGPVIGLEAHIEGGYHYLLGGDAVLNGTMPVDHPSQGWQLGAFGGVVLHLGI